MLSETLESVSSEFVFSIIFSCALNAFFAVALCASRTEFWLFSAVSATDFVRSTRWGTSVVIAAN